MAPDTINRLKELLTGDPEAESEPGRTGFLRANGLSVEKFARAIGVTRTSVYSYINDKKRPTLSTLIKICETVGISLAEGKAYCEPRESGRRKNT